MDGGVRPGGTAENVLGVGDISGHHLDPQRHQRIGIGSGPGKGPHPVAAFYEQPADVGTGQSGGAVRISGVSPQHTPATRIWFGKVSNEPGL